MGAAFATAAATLASDPNGSEAGAFFPLSGGLYPDDGEVCRVQFGEPGGPQGFGDTEVWNPGVALTVYHADLSRRPAKQDRLVVRGIRYGITGVRAMDALGNWTIADVDVV